LKNTDSSTVNGRKPGYGQVFTLIGL